MKSHLNVTKILFVCFLLECTVATTPAAMAPYRSGTRTTEGPSPGLLLSPVLGIQIDGDEVVVAWPETHETPVLQRSQSLRGPWTDVATSSPYREKIQPTSKIHVYFKVRPGEQDE